MSPRSRLLRSGASLLRVLPLIFLLILLLGGGLLAQAGHAGSTDAKAARAPIEHRVVILIDSDNEQVMRHAIGYTVNLSRDYAEKSEKLKIEIVTNGSGIKLFRADISPLQEPLEALRQTIPNVTYTVCDSALKIAEQKEGKSIPIILGARLVPLGIGRVVELEEAGWSYIHG